MSLPRAWTIKRKQHVQAIRRLGRKIVTSSLTFYLVKVAPPGQVLVVLPKRQISKSHDRNHLRRWTYHAYRQYRQALQGVDLLIFPARSVSLSFALIQEGFAEAFL